jgi:hypothetical protein
VEVLFCRDLSLKTCSLLMIDFLAEEESQLQIQLTTVCQAGEDFRLHINMDKTKVMSMGNNNAARIGL